MARLRAASWRARSGRSDMTRGSRAASWASSRRLSNTSSRASRSSSSVPGWGLLPHRQMLGCSTWKRGLSMGIVLVDLLGAASPRGTGYVSAWTGGESSRALRAAQSQRKTRKAARACVRCVLILRSDLSSFPLLIHRRAITKDRPPKRANVLKTRGLREGGYRQYCRTLWISLWKAERGQG